VQQCGGAVNKEMNNGMFWFVDGIKEGMDMAKVDDGA
jgi:hypothetical protein